jgi:hypothetical protein
MNVFWDVAPYRLAETYCVPEMLTASIIREILKQAMNITYQIVTY